MTERSARRVSPSGGYPAEAPHPDDPTTIGVYQVVGRLGAGGMGTVFLAQDAAEKFVAIKVIRSDLAADPEFRARFRDEVAAARRVAPFCTAQVLDADPDARRPYLVTEYIDGVRLDQAVTESGPLPLSTLQGVAVGVASALTAIHRAGIVHRDLKPSNVMLSYSGPRVIDFGIARALDMTKGRTQTGLVLGSVGWMAPEQMEGAALGPAVDVFAWGLLIGYAATGGHPYGHGTYLEMSEKILTGQPDLRAMPPDLTPIVRSALARDPRDRPSTENLLLTLLGERGRAGDARDAATALLDGTWPRGRSAAAAGAVAADGADGAGRPDPTHVATPYEQRRWWENESRPLGGDRWWNDSARDMPPPAGPPMPPPALAPPPAADRAAADSSSTTMRPTGTATDRVSTIPARGAIRRRHRTPARCTAASPGRILRRPVSPTRTSPTRTSPTRVGPTPAVPRRRHRPPGAGTAPP
ncbi:serine/threonine-protein kinase, partial [Frankia sp. CcWB3]